MTIQQRQGFTTWGIESSNQETAVKEKKIKQTNRTNQNMQIIWRNISTMPGWYSGCGEFNPKHTIERKDPCGEVTFQSYYSLSVKSLFQMTLDFSFDIFFGTFMNGFPPTWRGDYWLPVLRYTTSGLLQISKNGNHETKYYSLSEDTDTSFRVISSYSDEYLITADVGPHSVGFSIWDFSGEQPKQVLTEQGFESLNFELGNNLVIGFRESDASIELWNLNTRNKIGVLNSGWFKRGSNEESFAFREYIPERGLLLGDSGNYVYAFNIPQATLAWARQVGQINDSLNIEQPVKQKWLVCRAFSSNIVKVHCLATGDYLRHFEIGSNLKYDTDGFPLVIVGEHAISLDKEDNKKPVCWDLNTAQMIQEYESIDRQIHELYLSAEYLIGIYYKDETKPKDQAAFYLWDIKTGQLRKRFFFDIKDDQVQAINISNHILTFLITSNTQAHYIKKLQKRDSLLEKQPYFFATSSQRAQLKAYSGLIAPTNTLRLKLWDIQDLKLIGEVTENLTNVNPRLDAPPMSISFKEGVLVLQWQTSNGSYEFFMKEYRMPS